MNGIHTPERQSGVIIASKVLASNWVSFIARLGMNRDARVLCVAPGLPYSGMFFTRSYQDGVHCAVDSEVTVSFAASSSLRMGINSLLDVIFPPLYCNKATLKEAGELII